MVTYEEIFQRNIGVFTKEEQQKIGGLKIAIAGAGGLGGPVANFLARLGVGEIRVADDDVFDVSNINRQFGAYVDTIGKKKVLVIEAELERINPSLKTTAWPYKLTRDNMREFVNGCNVVVDALDFYEIETEYFLHEAARELGLIVYTGQSGGSIFSISNFHPQGASFGDMFFNSRQELDLKRLIQGFFPIMPREATPEMLNKILNKEKITLPSSSIGPTMGATFVVGEIIKSIKPNGSILYMPDLYVVDFFDSRITKLIDGKLVVV